jgi:hypothetical protein
MSDSSNEVQSDSVVTTFVQIMSLNRSNEATEAVENSTGAIESSTGGKNLTGIVVVGDGEPLIALVIEELYLTEDSNAHMVVEDEGLQPQSDTWIPLGPEGVTPLVDSFEDMPDGEDRRLIHTRLHDKVMLRTYVLGSVPDRRRRRNTPRPQQSTVLGPPAQSESNQSPPSPPLDDEAEDLLEMKTRLEECEEELDVLERALPVHSNDPKCIEWTQLTIGVAREAIESARQIDFREDELVNFAFAAVAQAYGFQEESLRRVNGSGGPSNYKSFEEETIRREDAIQLNRSQTPAFMCKEYYGDILDDIEDEEQDQEQEGNEMCVGSDLIKSGCKLTRAYDHTHRLNEDACDRRQ